MARVSMLDYPYVEPKLVGGPQRPSLIVLSSSFTTSDSGAAFGLANAMHKGWTRESYHYIVDEKQTLRCVDPKMMAEYADDTKHTLGVLMCDDPSGLPSRWDDTAHSLLLNRMADLVAQVCLSYKIPPRFLDTEELEKWSKWRIRRRGGVVVHGFMAQGYWPSEYFMTLVQANIEKHKLLKSR